MKKAFLLVLAFVSAATFFSCKHDDEDFYLDYSAVIVPAGGTFNLTGTVITNGSGDVTWKIEDDPHDGYPLVHTDGQNSGFLKNHYAKISDKGVVQGLNPGYAIVTAEAVGITVTCRVTVIDWNWDAQDTIGMKGDSGTEGSLEAKNEQISIPLKVIPAEAYINETKTVKINDYVSYNQSENTKIYFTIENGMVKIHGHPTGAARGQCKFSMACPVGLEQEGLGVEPLTLMVYVDISDSLEL